MAVPPFPDFSAVVTEALRNASKELADNLTKNNALLGQLQLRQKPLREQISHVYDLVNAGYSTKWVGR